MARFLNKFGLAKVQAHAPALGNHTELPPTQAFKTGFFTKFAGLAWSAAGKLSFKERDVSLFRIFSFVNPEYVFNLFVINYRTIQTIN